MKFGSLIYILLLFLVRNFFNQSKLLLVCWEVGGESVTALASQDSLHHFKACVIIKVYMVHSLL